jgi:hypothetical protein
MKIEINKHSKIKSTPVHNKSAIKGKCNSDRGAVSDIARVTSKFCWALRCLSLLFYIGQIRGKSPLAPALLLFREQSHHDPVNS